MATELTKKQLWLPDYIEKNKKWQSNDNRLKQIDIKIAQMIALDDLPFTHVEDIGFMELMMEVTPKYQLRQRNYYKKRLIQQNYILRGEVMKIIEENKVYGVSFTMDIWSNQVESLISQFNI
uniref:Uncharacterized protein n=1 Tax=Romanomermis culicivorax TaxID=13658 RepID=A0A915JZ14_ROMCU